MKKVLATALFLICCQSFAAEDVESLTVIKVTASPILSHGIDVNKVPAHIQSVTAEQLEAAQSLSLADYMNQHMGSVFVNETQNNPLQPDVYYRGFSASPLLGLPQGLSVYLNGVRFNEPFGDTVNWDLIPSNAIDSMALMSGSNPIYGQNTLGGAIAIKSKTGFSSPKHELEVSGGSWDRHSEELSSGGNNGEFGYFIDIKNFGDSGWRDHSRTTAKQGLGTLSWRQDRGELDLTLSATDNKMIGNGVIPIQLLNESNKAIYTHPDQTINRLFFSELSGKFDLTEAIELSGNAYFRQNRNKTFNGDDSDYTACDDVDSPFTEAACDTAVGAGNLATTEYDDGDPDYEKVYDLDGNQISENVSHSGTINTSKTMQRSRGGAVQAAFEHALAEDIDNLLTVGSSYDYANINFSQDTQLATLTGNRGVNGNGTYVRGQRVRLNTNTETYSAFLSDYLTLPYGVTLSAGGRYNHTRIEMKNQYIIGVDKLSGTHNYERFNPTVGFTFDAHPNATLYGSYSESSRAPTPSELTCADPDDPCKLPNGFVADPPLDQVVTKTWEGGVRGAFDIGDSKGAIDWNLGYFHAANHDDIQFIVEGDSTTEGYFKNIGQTRRYGVEAGSRIQYQSLFSTMDDWRFSANYTYLRAQYLDGYSIHDPRVAGESLGKVDVERGDRMTGMPEHMLKANLGVTLLSDWDLDIDAQYSGDQRYRGDEANVMDRLGGYWIFNFRSKYQITDNISLFGKVNNIFGREYKTFGAFADADEVLGDDYDNRRFVAPGAPREAFIGVKLSY